MHLLLNLDMTDPLVPIEPTAASLRFLPLYYPLRYGFGGGEVQYSVDCDERITILSPLHELGVDKGEDYPFPDQFPRMPIRLVPLNYVQLRAIAVSESGSNHHMEDPEQKKDLAILKELDYWRLIRLGGSFNPIQGDIKWPCANPHCKWKGQHVRIDVFASFTGRLSDDISIWGEFGECVEIYFGLMSCCHTITTVNRCT